jgi:hypothetical protein
MDEPTDPLARHLAVSALTTEQFNLQTARMGTIAEANGRTTLYLSTLSSAVIAIAVVGQANQLGDPFYLFALMVLPLRSLLEASVPVAAAIGTLVALGLAALFFAYQVRRFRRAAAVVPELYEGQSPELPGW